MLAALGGAASLAGLVLAYVLAWLLVSYAPRSGKIALSGRALLAIVVAASVAPLWELWARVPAAAEHDGLLGLEHWVESRLRLESTPAIAPLILASDRPQAFYVYAPAADRVRVTLAPGLTPIAAEPLGHGVFVVDYDPRREGAPAHEGAATWVDAELEVDGVSTRRALHAVRPAAHPRWPCVSRDRRLAAVPSEETDELVFLGAEAREMPVPTADGPRACAFLPGGEVLVALGHAGALAVHAPAEASLTAMGAPVLDVDWVREELVVAVLGAPRPSVVLGRVHARRFERSFEVGLDAPPTSVIATESFVVVATQAPASLRSYRLEEGHRLREVARRALLAPVTTMARVGVDQLAVATTDFDARGEPHTGNHFIQDQLLFLDVETLAVRAQVPTARRSPRQDAPGDVDRGVSPMGLATARDGSLLIAFAGSDEVWRMEHAAAPPRVLDVARLGLSAPHAAVELANGSLLVTSPSSGLIARLTPGARDLDYAVRLAPSDAELLRSDEDDARRRWGERAFYEGTRAGVSCQSCHLHGSSDGARHNIGGRVLAATLDVRGIAGTPPYLRDGSYARLGDLHSVGEEILRGWRAPGGDRRATLEQYLSTLPPPASTRRFAMPEPGELVRGVDAFFAADCARCHAPPAFTSLARLPARAVFEGHPRGALLDVPSLLQVGASAPYLHDGSAATLEEVLEASDRGHGDLGALGREERAALLAFLESLR